MPVFEGGGPKNVRLLILGCGGITVFPGAAVDRLLRFGVTGVLDTGV